MTYNFDEFVNRDNTNSMKWNYRNMVFGTDDVLPLWVADMDFPSPQSVQDAIIKRAQHPIYGYPGTPEAFNEAVVNWQKKRYGVDISGDWLSAIPGVVPGLHIAVDAYTQPGDHIIVQTPVYHPFFSTIKDRGRHIVENPLVEENGEYYMDLDDLKQKIDERTSMLILCSPHNPLGRVWTRQELLDLADICLKNDVMLIADEIHSDLVYDRSTFTSFYALPDEVTQNGMAFIAPSKTFNLAGLFTSIAMIKNQRLRRLFMTTRAKMAISHINIFGIEALIAAYNDGEEWLDEVLSYLHDNAVFVHNYLEKHIPQVKMKVPEATYLGWMDFRGLGLTGQSLDNFIVNKARLGFNSGAMFGQQGAGFQRINFACSRSVLEEAMDRLYKAVQTL